MSERDWKRIQAELSEAIPGGFEASGQAIGHVTKPSVQPDDAAILRHIADALWGSGAEFDGDKSVARDAGQTSSSRLRPIDY